MVKFPTIGLGFKEWSPTPEEVELWSAAYPGLDVTRELLQMEVWLRANPTRRKTPRGMPRFVINWLNNSQNRYAKGGRRYYDNPPNYSGSLKGGVDQRVTSPTAELRLSIERQVRAENPAWGWAEVRVECARRFNERMAGSPEMPRGREGGS